MNDILNNTLVLICAKGNSKGVKNKNIIKLRNKTLIEIAYDKAVLNNFRYFCLSTNSKKIKKISNSFGLKSFFLRSKNLCKENSAKFMVWKDALTRSEIFYNRKFKYILDIEVTNPIANHKDLSFFVKKFKKNINLKFDGLFCICRSKKNPYFNIMKKTGRGYKIFSNINSRMKIFSRQRAPITYDHVAAFYMLKRDYLLKKKSLFAGNLDGYELEDYKSIDIDSKFDLDIVKLIFNKMNKYV